MFLRTFFMLAATALVSVGAAASPAVDTKASVVATKDTEFGTLTFYGGVESGKSTLAARQVCGPPDVRCLPDSTIVPDVQACQLLIAALDVLPAFPIGNTTHAICAGLDNHEQCCVSWEKAGDDLESTDLVPAALSIFSRCVPGGQRAGAAADVDLRGECTRECLTNTPTPAACGLQVDPEPPSTTSTPTSTTTSTTTSTATATQAK